MSRPRLVHVVPRLAPAVCGVADYAATLASALEVRADGRFLVAGAEALPWSADLEVRVTAQDRSSCAAALLDAVGSDDAARGILLHYVNYGYDADGGPRWLAEALEDVKRRDPRVRLVTVFHEVAASGPPWTRTFWVAARQREVARRVATASDLAVTSTSAFLSTLAAWTARTLRLPVFSTGGEPPGPPPASQRDAALVVFGGAGLRERAYRTMRGGLARAVAAVGASEVIDVGPPSPAVPRAVAGVPVLARGHLPVRELSACLASARAAYVDYPADVLGKSTVFAALCAHAVPVFGPRVRRGRPVDTGLSDGRHFASRASGASRSPDPDLAEMGRAAWEWYRPHRLAAHVEAHLAPFAA